MENHSHFHTVKPMPQTLFNRIFALIYACAILGLLYHHTTNLFFSTTLLCFSITLILLISDLILAFMWLNTQTLRMYPVHRQQFPENLKKVLKSSQYPNLDVFICTADPYKEPPISVVNTALSVMAYDYPAEKISVYISDDGGSCLTLFALMEAAKFAGHWLPFCEENNIIDRSPQVYFESRQASVSETENIKIMYESMKFRIEDVLERGKVDEQYIDGDQESEFFNKWIDKFTRQDHPTIIQALLDSSKDRDITGHEMPNLIYVSREKSKTTHHHFKAGALNVLLRVSAALTNAPMILTLDCDMYSNDLQTPLNALCYLCDPDPAFVSNLGYVQFPQRFHSINKHDMYACAFRRLFEIQAIGLDGLNGPNYVGSGCFFSRRAFFGAPSTLVQPEILELGPDHVVDKPLQSDSVLALAHQVAGCDYENNTMWGSKIGFKYGSLVEDYYTGYRLQCEGWRSVFCHPKRAAFLGDAPISLLDLLSQQKRWSVGLLEVGFSKYSPITFGISSMGPLMGLGYAQYSFWPSWSIPIIVYSFLPQLALLNKVYIFPKVSDDPWFVVYAFLILGAYGQDLLDFILTGGSVQSWWNDQRIWHIRGLTCYLFGTIEFLLHTFGFSRFGFNVTSKVVDDEQHKRYEQGIFEFGVHSPMFVTLTMAALLNLVAFVKGGFDVSRGVGRFEDLFLQILIAGFAVVNSWPVYKAIFLRSDSGQMANKTTNMASFFVCLLCCIGYFVF
ncbi:LOW QUALITY PROTEIN: cellulose synthase-like protein G3 [Mercurialis annua]|uniref:LOW QUALITY PROTEIN: cellulose synthase-like protein G3 n=1 Tax=Mercurialis annua TaxID=3986 RepID=UPI0024AF0857|nr:LOW QUALITY PROTEIN: cellulose synthase-like protein G3 [Mercurialis annua]